MAVIELVPNSNGCLNRTFGINQCLRSGPIQRAKILSGVGLMRWAHRKPSEIVFHVPRAEAVACCDVVAAQALNLESQSGPRTIAVTTWTSTWIGRASPSDFWAR